MVSGRTRELNRTSCGIVLIGKNALLRKRIASILRGAGFRIANLAPDADIAFLQSIACERQTVSILEVNSSFEKTSRHPMSFRALCWFREGEAVTSKDLMPKKGLRSTRAGKRADGLSENAASSRTGAPAAAAGEPGPTDRQAMILESLVNGDSNKVVARKLHIAEETVKVHMKRLLRRIGVKNRTQAAIWALNNHFAPEESETGDLRRARSVIEPRSARRCAASKTALGGPPGPQLGRSRGGEVKGTGKSIRKSNIARYH